MIGENNTIENMDKTIFTRSVPIFADQDTLRCYIFCVVCGKKVYDKKSHISKRKCCSYKCISKLYKKILVGENNPHWRGGMIKKTCLICGEKYEIFNALKNKTKYCSKKCSGNAHAKYRSGKNSIHWRGGNFKKRKMKEDTRKIILERDLYKCVICGENSIKKLEIHHKIPMRYGGGDNLSNLITVCGKCHKREELLYYKKNIEGAV